MTASLTNQSKYSHQFLPRSQNNVSINTSPSWTTCCLMSSSLEKTRMNLNLNQPDDNVGGKGGQIKTDVATFHFFTRGHRSCPCLKHFGTVLPNFTLFIFFLPQEWFLAFVFANVRMAIFFMCSMPDIPVKEFYSEFFESVHLYLSEWQLIPLWQDPLSLINF